MKRLIVFLLFTSPLFAQVFPPPGGGGSLPTASAAGQAPVSTGSGTTYTAQTVALGSQAVAPVPIPTVSASQPTYVVAAFRDDVQSTYFQYSGDATNWVSGGAAPITPAGGGYVVRDIDWLFYPGNSTYYFYSTGGPNSFNTFSSTNLQTFSAQTGITVGTNIYDWRPTHVQDTSNNYYMYIGTATSGPSPTTIQVSQFTPGGTFGTWNTVTLNSESTCSSGLFDFRVIYNASNTTYYGFYACQQGGTTQYIHVATASTPTGPFTRINTGNNDPYGFGSSSENPDLIVLPSGNVRLMADTWVNIGTSGRVYTRKYVDTSGNFGTVIGSPVRVGGPESEGGTNITVTSQAVANTIFTAINHLPASAANNVMSPIGLDGPGYDPYSIAIWVPCSVSGQNCNSLGAGTPSLGMQNPIDNSWSTLDPYNVGGGVGFSIVPYSSGNQTALALDGSTQVNGKKWVLLNQSGVFASFDSSDNTTACMWIGVQTSFTNLYGCSALTTMGWNAQSQYVNASITLDTGMSRDSAGVIDFGNGTQGNKTAALNAASFNGLALTLGPGSGNANNVAIGPSALTGNTTGQYNVCIGALTCQSGGAASNNVIIGGFAGDSYSGTGNTAVGYSSGQNASGSNSTALGGNASIATFSNATALGYQATIAANNTVVIGNASVTDVYAGSTTGAAKAHAAAYINAGTTFTVAGCGTATALVGGSTAGRFAAASTTCAPVITTGITAPNGYYCTAQDLTTPADLFHQASSTTTTCTFASTTVISGDTVTFSAVPY